MDAILKRELITDRTLCRFLGVAIFVVLTALGGFVRIPLPFTPVPLTLQTFFVLLSGALLGPGLGMVSQLSYVFLGAVGLPIFSGAASSLLGPTTGYLFGFGLAAFLSGKLLGLGHQGRWYVFSVFCIADVVLLASGALWLMFLLRCSLERAVWLGFMPFILGDLLKASCASALYLALHPRCKDIF